MCIRDRFGPSYGSPEMMRRLLFSKDTPAAKLQQYFGLVQAESQMVAIDMMWLNTLRLKPGASPIPLLVQGAQHDVFVSPAMVRDLSLIHI